MVDLKKAEKLKADEDKNTSDRNFLLFLETSVSRARSFFNSYSGVYKNRLKSLAIVSFLKSVLLSLFWVLKKINIVFYKVGYSVIYVARFLVFLVLPLFKSLKQLPLSARGSFLGFLQLSFKKLTKAFHGVMTFRIDFSKAVPKFNLGIVKQAAILIPLIFILVLPFKVFTYFKDISEFKGRVMGISEKGIDNLLSASDVASDMNFARAKESFLSAEKNFYLARNEVKEISSLLSYVKPIIPSETLRAAAESEKILRAAELSALLGEQFSSLLFDLSEMNNDLYAILNKIDDFSDDAMSMARETTDAINSIDVSAIPEEARDNFLLAQEKSNDVVVIMEELFDIVGNIKSFLGFKNDKRYLFVFQNNSEMRGSGGFVGSYALVDFRNGKIKNMEVPGGGSYDTEAGLYYNVLAPAPLHLVNPLWHFWDANWWPDWKKSAQKLMWFFEKSDGPSVDGVIAITPNLVEDLLDIVGPIDMTEKYGEVISSDNFWEVTQAIVEEKEATSTMDVPEGELTAEEKHEPKKIIGDMIDVLSKKIFDNVSQDLLFKYLGALNKNLNEKHVLFYFNDENLQNWSERQGWAGRIKQSDGDYLMVVNSNIAGQKTDREIDEVISHKIEIQEDGSVIDTVNIKRKHNAIRGTEFTGVRNVDWMRIYVPLGSRLVSSTGFKAPGSHHFEKYDGEYETDKWVEAEENDALVDIKSGTRTYNESGKTVFANWSQVDPGETVEIELVYRLPFEIELISDNDQLFEKIDEIFDIKNIELSPFKLLIQKQPGSYRTEIKSELVLPGNFENVWQTRNLEEKDSGWVIEGDLNEDVYLGILLKKI